MVTGALTKNCFHRILSYRPLSHFFRCQVAQPMFHLTIHILHQGFTLPWPNQPVYQTPLRRLKIKNRAPHGAGLLCPPVYTFYSRSYTSTYKFWLTQVEWLFSGWTVSFLETRELNPWVSIFEQRKSQLHHFTIGFQKPGIYAYSWFLESNGTMVQLGFLWSRSFFPLSLGFTTAREEKERNQNICRCFFSKVKDHTENQYVD